MLFGTRRKIEFGNNINIKLNMLCWLGSCASLSFAQGPAFIDAKVKFSAQVFVEFSLLRMMPFPEDKCSFGLLHLLSDALSLETLREDVFSQL